MERIEEAVARYRENERWKERVHCLILNNVVHDYGMNRFGTRQARDAWREEIND
jgi:hypothetical protein